MGFCPTNMIHKNHIIVVCPNDGEEIEGALELRNGLGWRKRAAIDRKRKVVLRIEYM